MGCSTQYIEKDYDEEPPQDYGILLNETPKYILRESECYEIKKLSDVVLLLSCKVRKMIAGWYWERSRNEYKCDYENAVLVIIREYDSLDISDIMYELSASIFEQEFGCSAVLTEVEFICVVETFGGQKIVRIKPAKREDINIYKNFIAWPNSEYKSIIAISYLSQNRHPRDLIQAYLKKYPSCLDDKYISNTPQKESSWFVGTLSRFIQYLQDENVEIRDWAAETIMTFLARREFPKYIFGKSIEEQRDGINEIKKWYLVNKDFLYWDYDKTRFYIDDEAKTAGIPTDEYRKTHPWPKEEKDK